MPSLSGSSRAKRREMSDYIRDHSKSYIVEEIDSLGIKEIL
jgi:hypothetical protein